MTELFTDEKGEYGEPGQEYVFQPGKDKEKQEETRQKTTETRENTEENRVEQDKETKQAGLPTNTEEETKDQQEILFKGDNA